MLSSIATTAAGVAGGTLAGVLSSQLLPPLLAVVLLAGGVTVSALARAYVLLRWPRAVRLAGAGSRRPPRSRAGAAGGALTLLVAGSAVGGGLAATGHPGTNAAALLVGSSVGGYCALRAVEVARLRRVTGLPHLAPELSWTPARP